MLHKVKTEFHTEPPQVNISTSRLRIFCEEERRAGLHMHLLHV